MTRVLELTEGLDPDRPGLPEIAALDPSTLVCLAADGNGIGAPGPESPPRRRDEHDVDPVAERIATLGGVRIAAPSQIAGAHRGARAPAGAIAPRAMVQELRHATEATIFRARAGIVAADEGADQGTSDLLTSEVLQPREKEAWFLWAHLSRGPPGRRLNHFCLDGYPGRVSRRSPDTRHE